MPEEVTHSCSGLLQAASDCGSGSASCSPEWSSQLEFSTSPAGNALLPPGASHGLVGSAGSGKEPCPSLPVPLLQSDEFRNPTELPWFNSQQFRVIRALISLKHQALGAAAPWGPAAFIPSRAFICCHPLAWQAWLGITGLGWA